MAVRDNLKTILPNTDELPRLTREVFRNFGKYLVDFFRMVYDVDDRFIKERLKIKNAQYLKEVSEKGKGVLFLTAHMGNWEMGAVILSMLGYPSIAVALPHKERPVNDLFNQQREARGVIVVPTNTAVRRCLNALHENGAVAILADRDFSTNGEILDFLGRKALIPKGAATLSIKTGAAILPMFLLREKDDSFTLHIESPIYPPQVSSGELEKETVLAIMKRHTDVIEKKVREFPTQWLMFRRFWVHPHVRNEKIKL